MRSYFRSSSLMLAISSFLFLSLQSLAAQAEDKLVMFDSKSCGVCVKFKREMAGKYWGSDLGREVPLSIVNANNDRAMSRYEDNVDPINATPTFVLMRDGEEVTRFLGYSNEKSFLAQVKRARQSVGN